MKPGETSSLMSEEEITTKEQSVGQHARWKAVIGWRKLLEEDAKRGDEVLTSEFLEKARCAKAMLRPCKGKTAPM